jgi:hypothetical protein
MKRVIRIGSKRKSRLSGQERALTQDGNARLALIQALIPIGLEAVAEELEREVERLAGAKHSRSGGLPGHYRWGGQAGSVYLADEGEDKDSQGKERPGGKEVPLESYRLLQKPAMGRR